MSVKEWTDDVIYVANRLEEEFQSTEQLDRATAFATAIQIVSSARNEEMIKQQFSENRQRLAQEALERQQAMMNEHKRNEMIIQNPKTY